MTDIDDLVRTYWRHYEQSTSEERSERLAASDTRWAWDGVDRLVADEDSIVPLLVALAEAAPSDRALAYLGAGPVENTIRSGSAVVIDRLVGAAERYPRFQLALRCAWFDDLVDPAVRDRLRRFGPPV